MGGSDSCMGYRLQGETQGATPCSWLDKSLKFHQAGASSGIARDFSDQWNFFLVKNQGRFRRRFAWLVTLCSLYIVSSKTKWKRCRKLQMEMLLIMGWVPVSCTDFRGNGPPLAPEQADNALSLGRMGSCFLPEPGIQRVYPIVWDSHTSASLRRR